MYVYVCGPECYSWRGGAEDNLWELDLFSHHVGSGTDLQFDNKYLHLLSHLAAPFLDSSHLIFLLHNNTSLFKSKNLLQAERPTSTKLSNFYLLLLPGKPQK